MKCILKRFAAALVAGCALVPLSLNFAAAETVLRLDEVPVGELDPAKANDVADSILSFNLYDALVLAKQGGPGVEPYLAESWETDGATYTFKLREGVKFQSGNPLTAEDVVFSLDRIKGIGRGLSAMFKSVEKAEAIDERTVRFTLSQPYSPFVSALAGLAIVDKKLVLANLGAGDGEMKDWGQAFVSANAAGSGAYKVISHNPQEETVMAKNPDHFLGASPKAPDSVRFRYGLESATVRALIATGEHDISSQWLPPEVLKSLSAEGAQFLTESGASAFYVKMNTTKAPLDDVNCRLALVSAFDYASAVKMVALTDDLALGKPATGVIPVGMLGSDVESKPFAQDMDAARKHLAACKYKPEDFKLDISWIAEVPLEERFALLMQSNFAELGFKSDIVKMPWALYSEQVTKPETTPHFSQLFTDATTGDTDTLLYRMYHSSARGTFYSAEYLSDATVDELLDKGRAEPDLAVRGEIYAALGKRLKELAPTIPVYDRQTVFAASKRVNVPALTDKAKRFAAPSAGFSFRLMEMNE